MTITVCYLRFDVPMKDSITVHMIDGFQDLIHVILDALLWQVVSPALDGLVHVHIHQLKHKCKATSGLVTRKKRVKSIWDTEEFSLTKELHGA